MDKFTNINTLQWLSASISMYAASGIWDILWENKHLSLFSVKANDIC